MCVSAGILVVAGASAFAPPHFNMVVKTNFNMGVKVSKYVIMSEDAVSSDVIKAVRFGLGLGLGSGLGLGLGLNNY